MMEYVVSYIFLLINLSTCVFLYSIISKEKMKINIQKILLLLVLNFFSLMIRFLNFEYLNLISNLLFIFILIKLIYKIKMRKALYFDIIISIILLFCDAAISITINNNYLLNFDIFQKNFFLRALLIFPVCILAILFSYIPFVKKSINVFYEKFIDNFKFNRIHSLYLLLILNIIVISFCLNTYKGVNKLGHSIILLAILSFTLLFIVTLYLLYREYQIKLLNKNIIEENKYIKEIAKQDAEFKHNLINNLLGIKTISNKKTNKLIDCLIEDYQLDYKKITNINDLPNGIQSIIYRKAYEEKIEDLNLIVNNYIKEEIYDILTPKKYNHLCTSVGILFDNALEAVKNNFEKVIEINFEEDQEYIYFILKNSFSNILDLEETGKRNYTTKKNGHGIGLNYVKKLRTLEMKQEIINNTFIIKLRIKKAKKGDVRK